MKKLLFVFCLISLSAGVLFSSCNGSSKKENKDPNGPTAFEQVLTNKDSTDVRNLVDKYFRFVIDKKYYDAAAMLYERNPDNAEDSPVLFEQKRLERHVKLLEALPIVDYSIEYMKFDSEIQNEVRCKAVFVPANDKQSELSTKITFIPVRYLGYWVLTVANFDTGDHAIVPGDKRDSVRSSYEEKTHTND